MASSISLSIANGVVSHLYFAVGALYIKRNYNPIRTTTVYHSLLKDTLKLNISIKNNTKINDFIDRSHHATKLEGAHRHTQYGVLSSKWYTFAVGALYELHGIFLVERYTEIEYLQKK